MIPSALVLGRMRKLPTLSSSLTRLWALAADGSAGAADFERVIRPDPALSANLLRVANSAYFGLRSRAGSVRQAVAALGVKRVCDVATSVAFAPVIPDRLRGYGMDATAFWTHCVAVAILSERLAQELHAGPPDTLFTAGLLHDVGKLVVSACVEGEEERILLRVRGGQGFVEAERAELGSDHCDMGAAMAATWSLPPAVVSAARWHHRPGRAPEGPERTVAALIHAADALAHGLGFGADAGELARAVDAAAEAALGVTPRRLEAVASRSLDAVREMASLFTRAAGGKG